VPGDPNDATTFNQYAVEDNFLTTGETDMTKVQYDAVISAASTSGGTVSMAASFFADFNTEIAKLCSNTECDFETTQKVDRIKTVFKHLTAQIAAKKRLSRR